MSLELLPSYKCIAKQLEFVILLFKKVLKHHSTLRWALSHEIKAHMIVICASVFVSEALLLPQGVNVTQSLAARRVFLSHTFL